MTSLIKIISDASGNLTLHRYVDRKLIHVAKLDAQLHPISMIKEIIEDFRVNGFGEDDEPQVS